MSQEHAAAAFHAAKIAQLNAMGHSLDKLPPGLLPPHLDLSKLNSQHNSHTNNSPDLSRIHNTSGSVTIEPTNPKVPTSIGHHISDRVDIRRESSEPMDLGYDNNQSHHHHHHHSMDTRGHSAQIGGGGGGNGGGGGGNNGGGRNDGGRNDGGPIGGNSSGEEDNFSDEDPEQNS